MQKILFSLLVLILTVGAFAQNKPKENRSRELSVKSMMTATYVAGTSVPDEKAIGGFGASGNTPKKLGAENTYPKNALSLVAAPEQGALYSPEHEGFKLFLVNTTGEERWFSAVDSHLYILQEAQDKDGNWKPVEAEPTSWCGNSYHRVRLGANEFWAFAAPRYSGSFHTKLRFRLGRDETTPVYSNEFDGSVNPGQFVKPKSRFLF